MTSTRETPPPADLGPRGRAFWTAIVGQFELTETETELLRETARMLDECEALRKAVDRDGVSVPGSMGQTRVHPAVTELRQHRLALGKLLAQLSLPYEDGELASPSQVRASAAARARWAKAKEPRRGA